MKGNLGSFSKEPRTAGIGKDTRTANRRLVKDYSVKVCCGDKLFFFPNRFLINVIISYLNFFQIYWFRRRKNGRIIENLYLQLCNVFRL